MKKSEGIKKKTLIDTDKNMLITRGKGGQDRKSQKSVKGQIVMAGDLTWGGEHTIQHTDDVL